MTYILQCKVKTQNPTNIRKLFGKVLWNIQTFKLSKFLNIKQNKSKLKI